MAVSGGQRAVEGENVGPVHTTGEQREELNTYTYIRLKDCEELVGTEGTGTPTVNLYALVTEARAPSKSSKSHTGDWTASFSLTDPSLPPDSPTASPPTVTLILFAAKPQYLPHTRPGDVLRLHRVRYKLHNNSLQLVGKVGFRTAWALFAGDPDTSDAPTAISGFSFSHSPQHAEELAAIRAHGSAIRIANRPSLAHRYVRKLGDLGPLDGHVDLVGRVLAVQLPLDDCSSPATLWLWDGTDARTWALEDVPPDAAEEAPEMPLPGPSHPASVLVVPAAEMPGLGTALPVVVPERTAEELPLNSSGNILQGWVKLRNVLIRQTRSGHLQALFHQNSKWAETMIEPEVEEDNRERTVTAVWAPAAPSLFGTLVDPPHPAQDYHTLRQVHLAAGSANPAKFRVIAQVVGHWPLELVNFCSRRRDSGSGEMTWVWTVKLFLKDATAKLGVLLWAEDADNFFSGADLRPCDLRAQPTELHRLETLMARLLSVTRPPTWVDCCLRSFYRDKANPYATVSYRMFDTVVQTPRAQ